MTPRTYIERISGEIRRILLDAEVSGAEDEEMLPRKYRQIGDVTPHTISELVLCAWDSTAPSSVRRTAIIGLGMLTHGDEPQVKRSLCDLLLSGDVVLAEAALRTVDWGDLVGYSSELVRVSHDERYPLWLRNYALDLGEM